MRFDTHIAFGVLLFLITDYYLSLDNKVVYLGLFVLLSLLPDIDKHTSFLGKKMKIISFIFEKMFKHRGIFHSLWVSIVLYIVLARFGYGLAAIGYLGHVVLDMLNKKGVRLLWPFIRVKGLFLYGKIGDTVLFYLFVMLSSFICFYIYI